MTTFPIVTDGEVYDAYDYAGVVDAMYRAFEEHAAGTLEAPARWSVDAGEGALVFTAGAATGPVNAFGFRVYETFPGADSSAENTQLVAVYDGSTGALEGLFVGHAIGLLRTGGIGGVAVDCLAREDARTLGVLGSGPQARSQVGAACAVRDFDRVTVYSPTEANRESFAETVSGEVEPPVEALEDPEPVVSGADVLICATNSETPVFDLEWLSPGTHVNSLGPKFADGCELPPDLFDRADAVATDSLAQVDGYARKFVADGENRERMVDLADVLADSAPGRASADAVTLFCSVGLAGTEVVLGEHLLETVA
ncbi:ornithine cyclodeaminase family protein [Natrialbaceae archaeon GCM10025810]|uniref:ornithine cyclodeaminase family protein n=1 Tax=Halovalidus salilacus TaxID=3075124 RepID=UPI00360B5E5F